MTESVSEPHQIDLFGAARPKENRQEKATGHIVIEASAGTGKTYQLVERYLQCIEQGLLPENIVVITFTRKAAEELRQRIDQAVEKRYSEDFRHLQKLRLSLRKAPIGNFHSLSLEWLRGWQHQQTMPELMGEGGEDRDLFESACNSVWFDDKSYHSALSNAADYFEIETIIDCFWNLLSSVREQGVHFTDLKWPDIDAELERQRIHEELLNLRSELDSFAVTERLSVTSERKLQAFLARPTPSLFDDDSVWAEGWRAMSKTIDRRGSYKSILTAERMTLLKNGIDEPRASWHWSRLRPALKLLFEGAAHHYTELKHQSARMDFGDLIEAVIAKFRNRSPSAESTRNTVNVVMVDEAQDTNLLQIQWIQEVAGLTEIEPRRQSDTKLVVVGDPKQSIYTFRGADPNAFDTLKSMVADLGGMHQVLQTSWRSECEVVAFVNKIGRATMPELYSPLVAHETRQEGEVRFFERAKASEKDIAEADGVALSDKEQDAEEVAERVQRALNEPNSSPDNIVILLRTMTHAFRYLEALQKRGIAALTFGGSAFFEQPVIVDVIQLVRCICHPDDDLATASVLRSPLVGLSDDCLTRLTWEGSVGLHAWRSGDFLGAINAGAEPEAVQRLQSLAAMAGFSVDAAPQIPATSMDAAEWFLVAQSKLKLRERLLADYDSPEVAALYFDALMDLVFRDGGRRFVSLLSFADWLNQRLAAGGDIGSHADAEMAAGRVRIMTVHQSKGLEFDTVVLADLAATARNNLAPIRYDKDIGVVFLPKRDRVTLTTRLWRESAERQTKVEEAELTRLLYVAMTRAKRRLWMVGQKPPKTSPRHFAGLLTEGWTQ